MVESERYCLYCHTSPNGKRYFGITKNPKKRWQNGHGYSRNKHFYNAIVKYGWENFAHEILQDNLSWEDACLLEEWYIAKYRTHLYEYGYNGSLGGEKPGNGRQYSAEERAHRSRKMLGNKCGLGYRHTEDARRKISEAGHRRKGKPLTDSQREEVISHLPPPRYGKDNPQAKQVFCVELNIVYPCGRDAANALNLHPSHISNVCRGKRETTGGYHFEFWEG